MASRKKVTAAHLQTVPTVRPVDRRERQHAERVLRRLLGDLSEITVAIDQFRLIVEPDPLAPFIIHSVHRFGQLRKRKSA